MSNQSFPTSKYAGHSPAPWKPESYDGARSILDASGQRLMCDVAYYPWCPDKDADWNLMCDAPAILAQRDALLAALTGLMVALDAIPSELMPADRGADVAFNAARAAIASVEGGT